jgi:serine/threonine-protein kinase HipA
LDVSIARAATVLVGDHAAGRIERTDRGALFVYDDAFVEAAAASGRTRGIALHLPLAQRRVETTGASLHTFFAGLLPEGRRRRALVRHAKTSQDDLLSLLAAAGSDCVGDVSVVPVDGDPPRAAPRLDLAHVEEASFARLLADSLATGGADEPLVPGVQDKISAAGLAPGVGGSARAGAYLLKLSPADKPRLVQNEAFFMEMARDLGLVVASSRLVHDRDGVAGLLVERFDRVPRGDALERLHQEDACQLLDRYPADKYALKGRDIAAALAEVCAEPPVAVLRFLELVAFSYLIGNGKLHGKNVSIGWDADGRASLTPAYDLASTLPYGDRRMGLPIGGRDDKVRRITIVDVGVRLGIDAKAITAMLDRLIDASAPWIDRLDTIGLDARRADDLRTTITKRRGELAR